MENIKKNELVEKVVISVERYEALIITGLKLSADLAASIGDNEELSEENASLKEQIAKLEKEKEEITAKADDNHRLWSYSYDKATKLEEELKTLTDKYEQLCKDYDSACDLLDKVNAHG